MDIAHRTLDIAHRIMDLGHCVQGGGGLMYRCKIFDLTLDYRLELVRLANAM